MYSHAAASRWRWPRSLGNSHLQLFTSKAVSKRWGSSPGKCRRGQGRTLLLGWAWGSPIAPRGGPVCQLTQAAPEVVTVVWVSECSLVQPWSCRSKIEIWQEQKGGHELPREEGTGNSSDIFRAQDEEKRARARKPYSFFQVRSSYRSQLRM